MVNIIRFAKKISYKPILLGGSFYKLSALDNFKIKKYYIYNYKTDKNNIGINSINSINSIKIDNETIKQYYQVKYINEKDFSPFNYTDFRDKYRSYLNLNNKFLCDDDFTFFSMFNNLSLIHDVLKVVNIKHFNGLHLYYLYGLTIFDRLIKLYKANESANLNFTNYVKNNKSDLFAKIKSAKLIEDEYLIPSWNCAIDFFNEFQNYFFLRNIGEGGTGFVLECIKGIYKEYNGKKILTFSGPYACKFTFNELLKNELVPSRFQHENIVKILDSRNSYPLCHILMHRYEGNLFNIAKFHQSYNYEFLNRISLQIFDVLKYLRYKYFHNDIKPSNFLLDSNGNVILTDFSLGYDINVDCSTIYNPSTLLFCSGHILEKIKQLKNYNRDKLLEIYKDNKSKFWNSDVFKNNFSSEQDFDKLSKEEKYEFLIKNIKNFNNEINYKERDIYIADICDMRSGINPSTSKYYNTDVNGIRYPNESLCIENLPKSDLFAAAYLVHYLFNGFDKLNEFQNSKDINEIDNILEYRKYDSFKINYLNKNMDSRLKLMLRLITADDFFSNPDSLKQFDEEVKKYDNILKIEENRKNIKNRENRKDAVKKRLLKKNKKSNKPVKKNITKPFKEDCNQESLYDNILQYTKK